MLLSHCWQQEGKKKNLLHQKHNHFFTSFAFLLYRLTIHNTYRPLLPPYDNWRRFWPLLSSFFASPNNTSQQCTVVAYLCLGSGLLVVLHEVCHGRAGAHQVAVAVHVVDAARGGPELGGLHPGRGERRRLARVRPGPAAVEGGDDDEGAGCIYMSHFTSIDTNKQCYYVAFRSSWSIHSKYYTTLQHLNQWVQPPSLLAMYDVYT